MSTPLLKLGKKAATSSPKDLLFKTYLRTAQLPAHPKQFGHESLLDGHRQMLGNGPDDSVAPGFQGAGDCVFAAICNAIFLLNASAGVTVKFTGKEAIAAYSEVTGYVIGKDSTDQGTDMRVALAWLRKTGIADATGKRHKIGAFLAIKPDTLGHLEEAAYLGLLVLLGIHFPSSAMSQFDANKPWTVVKGATDEGGHCILFDALRATPKAETWARDQAASTGFFTKYVDEAWVIISEEALVSGKTIDGLDMAALLADLTALATK